MTVTGLLVYTYKYSIVFLSDDLRTTTSPSETVPLSFLVFEVRESIIYFSAVVFIAPKTALTSVFSDTNTPLRAAMYVIPSPLTVYSIVLGDGSVS